VFSAAVRISEFAGLSLIATLAVAGVSNDAATHPPYLMVVDGDRVTLKVADGPLVKVIEDLGRRMGFEVVASSVGELRVSAEFERLPSREAIRRICNSVGYVEVPDPTTGKIARLVLTGGSTGANQLAPRRDPLPPQPQVPVQIQPIEPPPPPEEPQTDGEGDDGG
jgi:hypothetical protein